MQRERSIHSSWLRPLFYARKSGTMKDMPALLAAYLTVADPDPGGPRLRARDRQWPHAAELRADHAVGPGRADVARHAAQAAGQGLAGEGLDARPHGRRNGQRSVTRRRGPHDPAEQPATPERRAFYGWLIAKPYDVAALPAEIAAFEAWKRDPSGSLPPVPFEWLTALPLTAEQWGQLAGDRRGCGPAWRSGGAQEGASPALPVDGGNGFRWRRRYR